MTFSSQIIEVINVLCAKFGIAIDWTTENVMPILQDLAGKYIQYEIKTSMAWIVIAAVIFVLAIVGMILNHVLWFDDEFLMVLLCGAVALCLVCAAVQTMDIIEAQTFPEKAIFEYVQTQLQSS